MQFPVSITIGESKILLHSIIEPLGYFIGFRYFLFLRSKQGDAIEMQNRVWILLGAIFGAVIGSHLVGGLEDPPQIKLADSLWIYFYSNKTVLGGFLGGLLGVEFVKKIIGEKKASGDLFTYPMILALMIGRLGCFSMGIYEETYGLPTKLPWGMHLGDMYTRHPVSLYEILWLAATWLMLIQLEKKWQLTEGARFKIFMISYCFFRFMLDFIKPHYTYSFGLSTIQVTALLGLIYYYRYIFNPSILTSRRKIIMNPATEHV